MEKTAKIAKQHNFDYFCSTLTVSPHKNSKIINDILNNDNNIENMVIDNSSVENEKVENIDKVVKTTFIQEEQQKFEDDSLDKDDQFINENDLISRALIEPFA